MKNIVKAYRFRIYPNQKQKEFFAKNFGCCRFVYNHFLAQKKERWEKNKEKYSRFDQQKDLKFLKKEEKYQWLKEVDSLGLIDSIRNLNVAYNNFFKNKQSGYPKFKSKHFTQSYHTANGEVRIENGKLRIRKCREGIKIHQHRPLEGRIRSACITKVSSEKYYVSLSCESVPHQPHPITNKPIGIDVGISALATFNDGTQEENHRFLKKNEKKLKYLQRQLSKKKKVKDESGRCKWSKNREKNKQKVARCHEKIVNRRDNFLHNLSSRIVKNHDHIGVEDLSVKNLLKNGRLAQSISDVSWSRFFGFLEYKSDWNDRSFVKVERFFASSKLCSKCGNYKKNLKLSDRKYNCDECGNSMNRDHNAAVNILKESLRIKEELLKNSGSVCDSEYKQKHGEALAVRGSTVYDC